MATTRAPIYACPDCAGGDRVHPLRRMHSHVEAPSRPRHPTAVGQGAGPDAPGAIEDTVQPLLKTRRLPAHTWDVYGGERWIACFIWGLSTTVLGALSLFLAYRTGAMATIGPPLFALWLLLGVVPLVLGTRRVLAGGPVPSTARCTISQRPRPLRLLYCERCDAVFLPYQASLIESVRQTAPAVPA